MTTIRPSKGILAEPYWRGLAEGRLLIQRCSDCGAWRHPPNPICAACHSFAHEWTAASGKARLYSYTIAHHPVHVSLESQVPYIVALVDLEEGVRMVTAIKRAAASELRIGMPLTCAIEALSPGFSLPFFVPDASGR